MVREDPAQVKFRYIEAEKANCQISWMRRLPGVGQSGFFVWQKRPAYCRQRQDMVCLAHLCTAFALPNRTCGRPRMDRDLSV